MTYVGKSPADIIATAVDTTTGTFSGDLTVDTNTLYVDSSNNRVGIGTSSPANKLHVYGGHIEIESASTDAVLYFDNSGNTGTLSITGSNNDMLFKTSGSERMRIDSSGNLYVGKTSTSSAVAGIFMQPSGGVDATRSGQRVLTLNRLTSDGNIIELQKDNTTVGSIGANSTQLIIGGTDTGIRFTGSQLNPMDMTTQTLVDNSKDIGSSSYRWKDLYLSGTAKIEKSGQALNLDTPSASQNVWMNFSDNGSAKWEIQKNTSNVLNIYSYDASSTVMSFDTAGHVTKPLQPAFAVTKYTKQNNIPLNTQTTVTFETEVFDQNNDFSSNTFTAPVTGKYQLNLYLRLNDLDTAAGFYQVKIVTSNRDHNLVTLDPNFASDLSYYFFSGSALADMDANDTAYITIYQNNGAAISDIESGIDTMFSGYLAC